jgi:hypothetical protein
VIWRKLQASLLPVWVATRSTMTLRLVPISVRDVDTLQIYVRKYICNVLVKILWTRIFFQNADAIKSPN